MMVKCSLELFLLYKEVFIERKNYRIIVHLSNFFIFSFVIIMNFMTILQVFGQCDWTGHHCGSRCAYKGDEELRFTFLLYLLAIFGTNILRV